jgi:hypothetical protein
MEYSICPLILFLPKPYCFFGRIPFQHVYKSEINHFLLELANASRQGDRTITGRTARVLTGFKNRNHQGLGPLLWMYAALRPGYIPSAVLLSPSTAAVSAFGNEYRQVPSMIMSSVHIPILLSLTVYVILHSQGPPYQGGLFRSLVQQIAHLFKMSFNL